MYIQEIQHAIDFATEAHAGQVRKYTGEDYITHPIAVMEIVSGVPHNLEMLIASVLHDVVEDCDVTLEEVYQEFGDVVGEYVKYMTNISKPEDGNRKERKTLDALHVSSGSPEVHTIKVADIYHNSGSIKKYDPEFWKTYKKEKTYLLGLLTNADKDLWMKTWKIVTED